MVLVAMLGLLMSAHAEQKDFAVDRGRQDWSFDVRWRDSAETVHTAHFDLPAPLVEADLEEPLRFQSREAAQHAAAAVRAYGETKKNVTLRVRVDNSNRVHIQASGQNGARVKAVLAEAAEVRDAALRDYMAEAGFTLLKGKIAPDHVRHALDYADDLAPLVAALGGPTADPRDFAELALGFVQSIPYEKRALVRDRFRRPLSVLGRNRGDCDSKSTLYLSLLRQAYPDLPLAMVYIPDHAYVALGLAPQAGDARLKRDGQTWVLAEPVGPRMAPVGEVDGKHRRALRFGRGTLRTIPTR